jgi:hypothetical protein
MNDKVTFSKTLEECMRSLRFDLDTLKVQLSSNFHIKGEATEHLYQLQEKLDILEKRLFDLTSSPPQFWPKVKTLAAKALEDASFSIQSAKQRYLH